MSADLVTELMAKLSDAEAETAEMRRLGRRRAEAESAYRIALATKILQLRADGMPVTITPDLARGDADVAARRLTRDAAEAEYEACRQRVYTLGLEAKIIDAQISREWRS